MRTRHIVAFVVLVGGSLASSAAFAWDQEPFAMYFQRSDKITLWEGDAKAVNAATHIIDPWPRYVGNRRMRRRSRRICTVQAEAVSAEAVSAAAVSAAAVVVLRAAAVRVAAVGPHNEAKPICGWGSILRR